MERKTVVLVVASQGYQPVEYGDTKKVLEDGGMSVITASNSQDMAVASDNSTTKVDLTINNLLPDRYDGIFFIGALALWII